MKKDFLDKDYLFQLSYLQYLMYQDKYYTIEEYKQIKKIVKKLINLLERGKEFW